MGDEHNEFSRQYMMGDALGEFERGQPGDQIVLAGEIAHIDPNEFIEYLKLASDPDYVLGESKEDILNNRGKVKKRKLVCNRDEIMYLPPVAKETKRPFWLEEDIENSAFDDIRVGGVPLDLVLTVYALERNR